MLPALPNRKIPAVLRDTDSKSAAQRPWRVSRHKSEQHNIEGRIQKLRPQPKTAVMKMKYKF